MSMSKKDGLLVHQLSSILPDDRPITAICVVEDAEKCPPNYTVVTRTYDLDVDADLWRESGLFIKKKTRYVCFSKTEGTPSCIIENIGVLDEKEAPPEGYSLIAQTVDSRQKAWRKRQLCYKMRKRDLCSEAVSDIIICSRVGKGSRTAPEEFTYAGAISGVGVCYKSIDLDNSHSYANIDLCQSVSSNESPRHPPAPERPPKPKLPAKPSPLRNGVYPQLKKHNGVMDNEDTDRDYEILSRPAFHAPAKTSQHFGTLPGSSDLDGVPFILNPLLGPCGFIDSHKFPNVKLRSREELDKEVISRVP